MKLLRLGEPGSERPAVLAADPDGVAHCYRLDSLTGDIDGDFLAGDGTAHVRAALDAGTLGEIHDAAEQRIGPPIARPSSLVCIGMNYAAHAAESGAPPPDTPVVFLKPANTVAGPYDPAPIPPRSSHYDWEVELGIVIGSRATYLASPDQARECIAGFVAANDLSERDYQLNAPAGQWTKGKSLPGSTPLGPWFVPADEIDPHRLRLRSWVNGEPRQDAWTEDLIFDPVTLVQHCSQYMLLEPGDVILTGTPAGVALSGKFPYLREADVFELEITGLGRQRQEFYRADVPTPLTEASA